MKLAQYNEYWVSTVDIDGLVLEHVYCKGSQWLFQYKDILPAK